MKRLTAAFVLIVFFLAACGNDAENITFTAIIENVSGNSMMVTTSDNVGFDRASVGYDKNLKIDFKPAAGQTVEITILPAIRESYPVQVTAVKIVLLAENTTQTAAGYKKITAEEAKVMIDIGNVIILDVRDQSEYDEGHIENALLLPYMEIKDKAAAVLPDKDVKILVYCRTGRRSEIAARELINMGYTSVYDIGGILDWPYETVK